MSARRRFGWPAIALATFTAVALLQVSGRLQFLEHHAADARFRILSREVASDIVVVGIDAASLSQLNAWPWPRAYHGQLIDTIARGEPSRMFIDIDFSSASDAANDARLEAALAAWPGEPVILPAFVQQASGADTHLVASRPLDRFARHATLASVNQPTAADGLVRGFRRVWLQSGTALPSVVGVIHGVDESRAESPIDFSIAPSSFTFYSYVEVLTGRVDPEEFRGRTVFVGATAIELNDILAVPVHRAVPGVVVQALALETARQGAPRYLPAWLSWISLALLTVGMAWVSHISGWRRSLVALVGGIALVCALSLYAFASHRLVIEILPAVLALGLVFVAASLRALDEQTLRAVAYALGIRRRDALLKSIVESYTDCIVCFDATGALQIANPAAARLLDRDAATLIGTPVGRFLPDLSGDLEKLSGSLFESQVVFEGGQSFPVEITVSRVDLNDERLYTAIVRDIRERKANQLALEYRATHDALSGLPNRAALMSHLQKTLDACPAGESVALYMLDLCRFKEVNDTLGHDVGDHVLREVSQRFRAAVGERGFLARIGGDEFNVVLEQSDDATASAFAVRLGEALRAPIDAQGVALDIGVSIGIARFPADARDSGTLLRRADVAMYVAKRSLAPFELYDEQRDGHSVRKLAMLARLRAAVGTSELQLKYQPQVDLRAGRVESVEALLRWEHPTLGSIGPAEFIPLAESTDLVRPLTEWTIRLALAQADEWRRQGLGLRIAVNLSARVLQDAEFPQRLKALLADHHALPGSLELEITESAMMVDPARALRAVKEISRLGVPITVDDYGTGFSSLGYLRDLPVHALKLDRSFITDMKDREDNRVIVTSTVLMAHALRLEVIAEGVEDEWTVRYLAEAGCDHAQGFVYAPALSPAECLAWVRRFNGAAPKAARAVND
jgi:diguanylate cyclase (GGDEF)-like protein/PAS domain S-box-containing protein